jgi:hypothetical protein
MNLVRRDTDLKNGRKDTERDADEHNMWKFQGQRK